MRKLLFIALAALSLTLTGCVKKDAVKIHAVEDIVISTSGNSVKAEAFLVVENTSGVNIRIVDAAFDITHISGAQVGKLIVEQEIFIPRKSIGEVTVPMRVKVDNPLLTLGLLRNKESIGSSILFTGNATIKAGGAKKKIEVENVSLDTLLSYVTEVPAGGNIQQL